jgi:hypothetical protein
LSGSQQNSGDDIDDESEKGENVGVDFRESESADNEENYFVARDADRAGIGHAKRPFSILTRNKLMRARREW